MLLVQLGRLITFTNEKLRNKLAVIIGIQDSKFVIIQHVLTMHRERVNLNTVKLLDIVIEISEEMSELDVQRIVDQQTVVKKYEESVDYKKWEKEDKFVRMNDFERFLHGVEERLGNEILKEKNLL
ncbi:hypothetical protein GVAV_003336 [Gurleya vavrai]